MHAEWAARPNPLDYREALFASGCGTRGRLDLFCEVLMGSVIKKRRTRMAKKKHRKLLRKTRVQRRRLGK